MIAAFILKKVIKDSYEALSQHNLSKVMSAWRDDGTLIYPGEVPQSGTYKGKGEIEGFLRIWFDQFPRVQFDIQNIFVRNNFDLRNNVAAVHWHIQLTNRDGRAGENSGVTIIEIKGGKVSLFQDFIFDQGENLKLMWGAA